MSSKCVPVLLVFVLLTAAFDWPEIDIHAGNAWSKEHDYKRAIESYTRAIDSQRLKGKTLAVAYFGRAAARESLALSRRPNDAALITALKDYNKAIALRSDEGGYYSRRGLIYAYLGAYEEAYADFKTARRFEGEKPIWSLIEKGLLQRRLGEYKNALESFRSVIDIWKPEVLMPPNYHIALTYMKMGKYQETVDALDEGMKGQSDFSWAYIIRACAKAKLGRYADALKDYQHGSDLYFKVPRFNPPYPSVAHNNQVLRENLKFLKDVVSGRIDPDRKRIAPLCTQNWSDLYYDKKRKRSPLLPD